jgi:hypothetical protein
MKWIRVADLEIWANTVGSRTGLSELVSALVRASASDANSYRFPTGDSAQTSGYDGSLEAKAVPPFIPEGRSVWEFGTGEDYLGKANRGYERRSANPLSAVPIETTFVFVTPRHWKRDDPSLEGWQKEKTAKGPWKEVRIVDSVALEDWLENCPAVAARRSSEGSRGGRARARARPGKEASPLFPQRAQSGSRTLHCGAA